ncbi:RsmD family RNA methyltransferase [Campylobacter sp.]|uniref:RsmD family RNA methyltransferase n=1 Tax=Campylobacter sp. TaxID=205 RepID=UPI0025BE9B29|nr:RsmD family RNA methyltransferase [Campylobacter sp.]
MAKFSKSGGTLFTQISSGIYKGKKLALPALSSTRSTKSIVKGSFFDTWRVELRGAAFIECFGGSGAMALEALSNGAKNVYAIEKDAAAHKIMRKNFELFGLGANTILGDCFERLPQILHDLQADMNGRSGANSPNLSGNNFKNRTADAACYKNLSSEKEGCRKSFNSVERGEDGYRAEQSVEAQSGVKYLAKYGTRSSMYDRVQNSAQSGANGDYAGASSIKYCVNSLATDAMSFSKKFDDNCASEYNASGTETANCNLNLSSKCSESSNFGVNHGAGLDVSCEEKKSLNLGENFDSSCRKSLHSSANFVYDSRKNSTANSDGNFAASCKENSRPNVNLTRGSRKNFDVNSRENFACDLGESPAENSSESHTANSKENSISDPVRRVFVYLDPPFAIRQGFGEIYERVLALIARLGSVQCELLIAIEHMSELELPLKIGDFVLLKSRKFGTTTMSYYAK